jgi:ribosomal protein S18 acetylase RimI-like enzyme
MRNQDLKISNVDRGDLPRILAIQKDAYLSEAAIYDDYSLPPLLQSLEQLAAEFTSKLFLKAEASGAIVGSVRVSRVDTTCIVERLIVDPRFQRRGIGSSLIVHAEARFPDASRFELFTGAKSTANIRLYESHGYRTFREEMLSPAVSLVYMQKLKNPGWSSQC